MYTNIQGGGQSHYRSSRLLGASRIAGAAANAISSHKFMCSCRGIPAQLLLPEAFEFFILRRNTKILAGAFKKSEMGRSEAKLYYILIAGAKGSTNWVITYDS